MQEETVVYFGSWFVRSEAIFAGPQNGAGGLVDEVGCSTAEGA